MPHSRSVPVAAAAFPCFAPDATSVVATVGIGDTHFHSCFLAVDARSLPSCRCVDIATLGVDGPRGSPPQAMRTSRPTDNRQCSQVVPLPLLPKNVGPETTRCLHCPATVARYGRAASVLHSGAHRCQRQAMAAHTPGLCRLCQLSRRWGPGAIRCLHCPAVVAWLSVCRNAETKRRLCGCVAVARLPRHWGMETTAHQG